MHQENRHHSQRWYLFSSFSYGFCKVFHHVNHVFYFSEFYTGWLTHWGENIASTDATQTATYLEKILSKNGSAVLYVCLQAQCFWLSKMTVTTHRITYALYSRWHMVAQTLDFIVVPTLEQMSPTTSLTLHPMIM